MTTLRALYGNNKPTVPAAILHSLTDKELLFMSKWNGPAAQTPAELEAHSTLLETMAPYINKLSAASRTAINEALADRRAGITLHVGNPEQSLWKTGGATYYDKDFLFMAQSTGDVKVVPNTIIPDPLGRRRNGLVPMTVLIASLCKVKKGELVLLHDAQNFHKRWHTHAAPFKPFRMLEVLEVFHKAICVAPAWKAIVEEEQTLTNERLVEFLYSCLHDMEDMLYYYLHTFVVFELLTVFEEVSSKKDDSARLKGLRFSLLRIKRAGQFSVPETAYTVLTKADVSRKVRNELLSMGYPAVVVFRGGLKPNIKVIDETDMASAVAAKALSLTTRGSDKSAMSFMCRNAPYSGLAIEEVRVLQRCVAMVGGVIKSGKSDVDIEVSSVAHVPILFTSLTAHFPTKNWSLSMSSEMSMKCSMAYASRISTDRRQGSHLVRYVPYQMKSHTLKQKEGNDELIQVSLGNYNADSTKWRPNQGYSGYTLYTTIFGYYPWAVPNPSTEEEKKRAAVLDRSYLERQCPPSPHYVYRFGQTESFCGIISTISAFALFGQNVKVTTKETTAGVRNDIAFDDAKVPLDCILTETEWYRRVIESNAAMEAYWMHARPKFSPISNVLRIPKNGVTVTYDSLGEMVIEDQGGYVDVAQYSPIAEEKLDQTLVGQQSEYDSGSDAEYEVDAPSEANTSEEEAEHAIPEEESEEEEQPMIPLAAIPKSLAQLQQEKTKSSTSSTTSVPPPSNPPRPARPQSKKKEENLLPFPTVGVGNM